eukprot:GHRQ01026269.1.p1 GENE.GHRQ01026269.1~~GHRQ01026269.1.p1  ORF type:complete len:133 (+),score=34.24 GHRQ01026269.1:735-1133(+)
MPAPGAVGVSINCEKLVKMLLQKRQKAARAAHGAGGAAAAGSGGVGLEAGGGLPAGQCDVLVCARGEDGMLRVSLSVPCTGRLEFEKPPLCCLCIAAASSFVGARTGRLCVVWQQTILRHLEASNPSQQLQK